MNTLIRIVVWIVILGVIGYAIVYYYPEKIPPPPKDTVTTTESAPKPLRTVSYVCDAGKTIKAAYFEDADANADMERKKEMPDQTADDPAAMPPPTPAGSVTLSFETSKPTMTLSQTISADGVRYANADESFVFWNKGNGALVLENDAEKNYTGCIAAAELEQGSPLVRVYANSGVGFSLRLPNFIVSPSSGDESAYVVDTAYAYDDLGPGKEIKGIQFTIPGTVATGTNLSSDSYVSVEHLASTTGCSGALFLAKGAATSTLEENGVTYSVASSTGAAAGNRYVEKVYAFPDTNPCLAVRYFIHYGVFENYPAGSVKQFDLEVLLSQFDRIRQTLVIN